jgi:hypothetical protein
MVSKLRLEKLQQHVKVKTHMSKLGSVVYSSLQHGQWRPKMDTCLATYMPWQSKLKWKPSNSKEFHYSTWLIQQDPNTNTYWFLSLFHTSANCFWRDILNIFLCVGLFGTLERQFWLKRTLSREIVMSVKKYNWIEPK